MSRNKPQWTEIEDFRKQAKQIMAQHSDRFAEISPDWIVAYGSDKPRQATDSRPYQMFGESEPASFPRASRYFVAMCLSDWEAMTDAQRSELVRSVLMRVDPEHPESGKVLARNRS